MNGCQDKKMLVEGAISGWWLGWGLLRWTDASSMERLDERLLCIRDAGTQERCVSEIYRNREAGLLNVALE